MVTVLHIWPDTKTRWIEITDGSFHDNLGLQSLLRRQVSRVIVGDAALDNTWQVRLPAKSAGEHQRLFR